MSLQDLRDNAYDILQIPSDKRADFNTVALSLFNMARLGAERNHDFAYSKGLAYLRVTASDGSLLSAAQASYSSEAPSGASVTVKSVQRVEVRLNQQWVAATLMENESRLELDQRFAELNTFPYGYESSVPRLFVVDNTVRISWFGGRWYSSSTDNVDLKIYGSVWLPAYANWSAPDDFLIIYGPEYMLWYGVHALNHKSGTFLSRQEGSLDPSYPKAMRDEAWESLILWDRYLNLSQLDIISRA